MQKVACGTLIWGERVLVGKRMADNPIFPNKWEFPGGKVEENETPEEAIVREFQEELEIEVIPFHHMVPVSNNTTEMIPFALMLSGGIAKMNAHSEIRFVTEAEFKELDSTELTNKIAYNLFNNYDMFLRLGL